VLVHRRTIPNIWGRELSGIEWFNRNRFGESEGTMSDIKSTSQTRSRTDTDVESQATVVPSRQRAKGQKSQRRGSLLTIPSFCNFRLSKTEASMAANPEMNEIPPVPSRPLAMLERARTRETTRALSTPPKSPRYKRSKAPSLKHTVSSLMQDVEKELARAQSPGSEAWSDYSRGSSHASSGAQSYAQEMRREGIWQQDGGRRWEEEPRKMVSAQHVRRMQSGVSEASQYSRASRADNRRYHAKQPTPWRQI